MPPCRDHGLLAAIAACLLVLAGAAPAVCFQATPDLSTAKTYAADENTSTKKPPPPRTLPQAICAYLRCLHCPPPPEKKDDKNGAGNNSDEKKNPPAQGTEKKNGEQKNSADKGGTKDEGKKNPPAAGDEDKEKADAEKEKDKEPAKAKEEVGPAWYSAHAQATLVVQQHNHFNSPYIGPNSLRPVESMANSITGTLFLDARLWECGAYMGDVVFNPEMAGGRGLSNTTGIADFPNGEITRVGVLDPTPYIARLFLRQTIGFGGEQETVEDDANQLAGKRDINRLTIITGKLSATDLVDFNVYSHDPRTQFLPWGVMYNGAWDYPANVRGYTYGIALDYNEKDWALRYGVFQEPRVANGAALDVHVLKAQGQVLEWLGRYKLCHHPGNLRLLAFLNRAHMGDYTEALAAMPVNPDVTLTRQYRFKYGFGLSWDQELTKDLGVFSRLGWNDGHTESWAFTAIDRIAEVGLLLKGRCWCRPNDQVGLAFAACGLSNVHREYLAAGGLDFIIGDGRLRYGPEETFETFYEWQVYKGIFVTADFQEVNHPAYNRDRGPVSIGTLRVHIEF
jgi:high affinity Mn2+ porin